MSEDVPCMRKAEADSDFSEVVAVVSEKISRLPKMDYDALYAELNSCSVELSGSPTLERLAQDMQKIQALKDRVAQIMRDSTRNSILLKRTMEILVKGGNTFSQGKSEDKRNGESQIRMAEFIMASAEAESFDRAAQGVMRNLDSQHETAYKQLDDFRLSLKLRDYRAYGGQPSSRQEDDVATDWGKYE